MQQTEFIGGRIWGELDTGVAVSGDTAARSGAAFFDVRPTLREGVLSAARIDLFHADGHQTGHVILDPGERTGGLL